jgi:nucleosome binding factor SPN SPT16 subunit
LEVTKRDGRRIFIKNVAMKTGSNTRRTPGVLEAYPNGLRYSGPRIETLDINYSTIKHAFFQPCENELIVLLHFHLKVCSFFISYI